MEKGGKLMSSILLIKRGLGQDLSLAIKQHPRGIGDRKGKQGAPHGAEEKRMRG